MLLTFSWIVGSGFVALAQEPPKSIDQQVSEAPQLVFQPHAKEPGIAVVSDLENAMPDQAIEILDQLPKNSQRDILISTDDTNEKLIETVVDWKAKRPDLKSPKFLISSAKKIGNQLNSAGKAIAGYPKKLYEAAKNDKIGLIITVVTTSYDSFIWIHSSSNHWFSMMAFNIVFAIAFGIDRDHWTKIVRPIDNTLMGRFKALGLVKTDGQNKGMAYFASKYLANLSLSLSIQVLRFGLLSLDHLADAITRPQFWIVSGSLAAALTFSGFGWTEQAADTNERTHPVAKSIFRRLYDFRTILLGYTSPSGKLIQYDSYGLMPWIALLTNGISGVASLVRSDRVVDWIEHNRWTNLVHSKLQSIETRLTPSTLMFWRSKVPILGLRCSKALGI